MTEKDSIKATISDSDLTKISGGAADINPTDNTCYCGKCGMWVNWKTYSKDDTRYCSNCGIML